MDTGEARGPENTRERLRFRGSWSGRERNVAFWNPEGEPGQLFELAYLLGLDHDTDGRAVAPFDMDGDGDLDLVTHGLQGLRLFENRLSEGQLSESRLSEDRRSENRRSENRRPASGPGDARAAGGNHFVRVRLRAAHGDLQAIGAEVVVETADGVTRRARVSPVEGFQTQVPLELTFGLGRNQTIARLRVQWPDGSATELADLPVDRRLVVTQGRASAPGAGAATGAATVTSATLPRWPDAARPRGSRAFSFSLVAKALGGSERPIGQPGRPTVVNVWAPWCAPCQKELPELKALSDELGDRVAFVGLSAEVDKLDEVRAAIARHGLTYPQLLLDDAIVGSLFPEGRGKIPLPTTFVVDAEGRLRRVFSRPVEASELRSVLDSLAANAPFADDLALRGQLAIEQRRYAEAIRWLGRAIAADDAVARYHNNLGFARGASGDHKGAAASFSRAAELDDGNPDYWFNAGAARLQAKAPADAARYLRRSLSLRPAHTRTLHVLATALAEAGDVAAALRTYDEAAAADPRSPLPWARKGKLLQSLGRDQEARDAFVEASRRQR